MAASDARPAGRIERFGRLWWLPAGGLGNGLDDTAWTPLAAGEQRVMQALLTELRQAGVPAYAAPVTRRPSRRVHAEREGRYQLWVGASRYTCAEEVLRVRLPVLLAERTVRQPR
jgi:hypothetical protein